MKTLKTDCKAGKRGAFALILAIAAMAFMVLLVLTLSSVITSKLRLLNAQKEMRAARSNAVLGMSIAISQLQLNLGRDNAISIPSSILDSDPETPEIEGVNMPYLMGSIVLSKDNSSLTAKDLQDEQRAMVDSLKKGNSVDEISWYVSSETNVKNPAEENLNDLSAETVNLAEFKILTSYPNSYGGSIGSMQKSQTVQVQAGKVRFSTKGDASKDGAYAWWVSDESMKAKINLTRPDRYLNESMGSASEGKAPMDSRLPQISNTSFVDALSNFSLNPFLDSYDEQAADVLSRLNSLDELPIIDSSLSTWAKDNKNDWTANSVGIPVDVTQGRLKEDLTAYFEGGHGLQDSDVIIRGHNNDRKYTGPKFGIQNYTKNLPRFGQLKDWAEIAKDKNRFSDTADVKAWSTESGSPAHGINPVILRAAWTFIPVYEGDAGALHGNLKISLLMYPRIWLWNPNNVAISSTDYIIRLYMPLSFTMHLNTANANDSNSNKPTSVHWARKYYDVYKKDDQGVFKEKETQPLRVDYKGSGDGYAFYKIFPQGVADGGMPALNFQVQGLSIYPGEVVELNVRSSGSNIPVYQDVNVNSLLGSSFNELELGTIAPVSTNTTVDITLGKAIRLDIGAELQVDTETIPPELSVAVFDAVSNKFTSPDGEEEYRPASQDSRQYLGPANLVGIKPAIESIWGVKGLVATASGSYIPPKVGYELWANTPRNGLQRLLVNDKREWTTQSTVSRVTNASHYRHDTTREFHRQYIMRDYAYNFDNQVKVDSDYRMKVIMPIDNFIGDNAVTFKDSDWTSGKFAYLFGGRKDTPKFEGYGGNANNYKKYFFENTNIRTFGFRLQDWDRAYSPVYTVHNLRATSAISGNSNANSVIRIPESKKGTPNNFGIAMNFTDISRSNDVLFGKRTSSWNGSFSFRNGQLPRNSQLSSDNFISAFGGLGSDRYGIPLFLSGEARGNGYGYDYHAYAMFDYPRKPEDLISLGFLSHANLSPMPWQPSVAFGDSFHSAFMDRENIFEMPNTTMESTQPNQLIDISYMLNASMWDRFYMSSLYENKISGELKAGMRLPNTRYFLKNVPQNKGELYGSDEAFEKSAAYVGIDGVFNVNSTSYEAWRAFLGGMLGTKKTTIIGDTINEETKDSSDPENFKMPNPGSMNPIAKPAEYSQYKYYHYMDTMVGRRISEAEIDELAREIVAEVKRRAPFFSLSDFVNRRLIKAESGADKEAINKKYEGLMGTISAAIKRASMNLEGNRPNYFYNSSSLEWDKGNMGNKDSGSYAAYTNKTSITSFDGDHGEIDGQGGVKDLGASIKGEKSTPNDKKQQYYEQAIRTPWVEDGKHWATKLEGLPGFLNQRDILSMIGPFITVRGDTFTVRAYGESKNPMTGTTTKAYCEAVVQRSSDPVEASDDIIAPESEFGRRFNVVSFRWLTPAEL